MNVEIRFNDAEARYANRTYVQRVVSEYLGGLASAESSSTIRVGEVTTRRNRDRGNPTSVVVGIEGSVVSNGRPTDEVVQRVRAGLLSAGYGLKLSEKRMCREPGCTTLAVVLWNQSETPREWHSPDICGRHNYRTCLKCASVYVLTSQNAAGPNPSVHCEVCSTVLVEWGSSKTWEAVLVTRGKVIERVVKT